MKIFPLRKIFLFLLVGIFYIPFIGNVKANHNVTCTAGVNTTPGGIGIINIGSAITLDNIESASVTVPVNIECRNTGTDAANLTFCLAVDGGNYINNSISPRYMKINSLEPKLAFQLSLPDVIPWSSRTYGGAEYYSNSINIQARFFNGNPRIFERTVLLTANLVPGFNNPQSPAGTYTNDFGDGNHTSLTVRSAHINPNINAYDCRNIAQGSVRFPFRVQATVVSNCVIQTTSDMNLGTRIAGTTNLLGANDSITVQCNQNIPYRIGLAPSNGNSAGAGVLRGTSPNTDTIPYQLRSTSGLGGQIWGNTATATSTGNGISRVGTGNNQYLSVYVTIPNTNVTPDNYSDTVTVRVHY